MHDIKYHLKLPPLLDQLLRGHLLASPTGPTGTHTCANVKSLLCEKQDFSTHISKQAVNSWESIFKKEAIK